MFEDEHGRITGMSMKLILLRHGESQWNEKNLFTGWVDVPLSLKGEQEAKRAGELFKNRGLLPDILHTSLLKRAINTAEIALNECDRQWIQVRRSWRLNERHYGALQGKNKAETLAQYGEEQFLLWRRSLTYHHRPLMIQICTRRSATYVIPTWDLRYQRPNVC